MVTAQDIAWAAGFLEGEGSFTCRGKTVIVSASQVQQEPLLRLQRMFGGKLYHYTQANPKHSPFTRWHLYHVRARGLMLTLYMFMSPKRRGQIDKALSGWRARNRQSQYRTHCPRGHAYTEANLLKKTDHTQGRKCRECARVAPWTRRQLRMIPNTAVQGEAT